MGTRGRRRNHLDTYHSKWWLRHFFPIIMIGLKANPNNGYHGITLRQLKHSSFVILQTLRLISIPENSSGRLKAWRARFFNFSVAKRRQWRRSADIGRSVSLHANSSALQFPAIPLCQTPIQIMSRSNTRHLITKNTLDYVWEHSQRTQAYIVTPLWRSPHFGAVCIPLRWRHLLLIFCCSGLNVWNMSLVNKGAEKKSLTRFGLVEQRFRLLRKKSELRRI